jgi:putative transposase
MRLGFKYRIYPTRAQTTKINDNLESCRFLYNLFLEERKTAWEKCRKNVGLYDQLNRLPRLKKTYPTLKNVHSQALQNVGVRLDLAMQAFFRRVRQKQNPGYPRFKARGRYTSFTYPNAACAGIVGGKIYLPKIGNVAIEQHRPLEGVAKTVTVMREPTGKCYVVITCDDVVRDKLSQNTKAVGVDVGILTFATLSDGTEIKNPRFFETDQRALGGASRKAKSTKNYKPVRRIHERIKHRRDNFNHQTSLALVKNYGKIFTEDIDANALIRKRWCNKQILDAAWADFLAKLSYKAAYAGREFMKVNPAYTSQTCSACGTRTLHELKDRTFECSCGHKENRDLNAARNILALGLQCVAQA